MNAKIVKMHIFMKLSMTSEVIEGHKRTLLCLLNLNLRSYGQLLVLVFLVVL